MLHGHSFDSLATSPNFSGWTSDSVVDVLSAVPFYFFLRPRSIARQPSSRHRSPLRRAVPSPRLVRFLDRSTRSSLGLSRSLDFYSWLHLHCRFSHCEATCRAMSLLIARANRLRQLWQFLRANASHVNLTTVTSIITLLGAQGLAAESLAVFYRMKQLRCKPDTIAYNAVITALCHAGLLQRARSLLDQMELPGTSCPPDAHTYTILISAYCKRGAQTGCCKAVRRRMWEANRMFRRMLLYGAVPDVVTYNCLISGMCRTYRIGRAHQLFDEMLSRSLSPNRVTYNSFICYYCAVNEVEKAITMMRSMVERNHGLPTTSSYTPIIHVLCETGRATEAASFLRDLVDGGSIPREFTYRLVCCALGRAGEEGLPFELRKRIEMGIDARFGSVMQVKPIMRREIMPALPDLSTSC